jgi:triacylglycerol esterase/lipase EstA (alpha/beta hydrolase family)
VRRRCLRMWAVLVSLLVLGLSPASAARASTSNTANPPPGANDWSCRPSRIHPRPVVLVHGTFVNMAVEWAKLSPVLARKGYCVFALNYGIQPVYPVVGTGPIEESARQLSAFVDKVLASTGASQVDIVGRSQGGMMPRYYLKFLGGAAKVRRLIGLVPPNHGTTAFGLAALIESTKTEQLLETVGCPACRQQLAGSDFLRRLNSGGDTVPGVTYTVIATVYDEVVTPYTSAFLEGPRATNITVQDQCVLDFTEHLLITYDPVAIQDVLNALEPAHATPITCVPRS